MKRPRIIIADGNRFFREGLKAILLNMAAVEVVGEVDNKNDLLEILKARRVDIVFFDLFLRGHGAFELVQTVHGQYPQTRFIAFTSLENKRYVQRMVLAGASGYLVKSDDNHDLLRQIIRGDQADFCLSPGMHDHLLQVEIH